VTRGEVVGVVHVRDTMTADDSATAGDLMRPVLRLDASMPVYAALTTMRETRNHLAVVDGAGGLGVVTLADVLQRLFPETMAA
jgi:CBS domain containing-hemolysin-like protein